MRGLQGKTGIVTGGGGVIGRGICLRLAQEGATIGVFDRDASAAERIAAECSSVGPKAHAHTVDITDYKAVASAVAAFEAAAGPTDILVNNAGWEKPGYFLDTEPALWDQLIAVNLKGPINLLHVVLAGMQKRKCGRVVNIASDAGRVGSSMEAVYSACKGGIIAFTKSLAREMARSRVTLNAVCPGPTETPMLQGFLSAGDQGRKVYEALKSAAPLKRMGEPDDVAAITAFLASDDAAFITGQVISVSGGLTMNG